MKPEPDIKKTDGDLIRRFIGVCSARFMTLAQMGAEVGKTKQWASLIVNGEISTLRFNTRNRIAAFLRRVK